jgi:phosphoribosylglycinamide formyltransferase-1
MTRTRLLRIGVFISGGGTNLRAIIDACNAGTLHGRVAFVGSDNRNAAGLQYARSAGIATFTVDYRAIIAHYRRSPRRFDMLPEDFDLPELQSKQRLYPDAASARCVEFLETRAAAEARLLDHMGRFQFDLLVLAGYMRTLSPYFIDRVNRERDRPCIMNIHPALLPAFPGTDGYGDTYRYGCKIGGCSVHFVDYGEDSGPIIGQSVFPIDETDTLASVRQKGLRHEWALYPRCIQLFAENRLQIIERTHRLPGKSTTRAVVRIRPAAST